MEKIHDDTYHFKGYLGCDSKCRLKVYRNSDHTIVIATELDDNPGTSITNVAEKLATSVCQRFEISDSQLVWIEHYPDRHFSGGRPLMVETFDFVTFERSGEQLRRPKWQRTSRPAVEMLIGESLDGREVRRAKFEMGRLVATPGALEKWYSEVSGFLLRELDEDYMWKLAGRAGEQLQHPKPVPENIQSFVNHMYTLITRLDGFVEELRGSADSL